MPVKIHNQPGKYVVDTYAANGSLANHQEFGASAMSITKNVTSTSGAKPKPLVPRPYHINCSRCSAVMSNFRQNNANGSYIIASGPILHPDSSGYTLLPPYDFTNLQTKAISKLTDSVRGDLDVSVDLAEAGKTLKLLKLADEAVNYTKTFVNRFGVVRVASKAWLTYQYGMRPLMKTIFGLAEENLRHVLGQSQHYHVRVSEVFVPTHVQYAHAVAGVITMKVRSSSIKKSVTIGCDIRTDQFDPARFSSLNPASIAWELTPLSFVADWFFNVGGYLRNMETYVLNANKFRSGYITNLSVGTVACSDFRYDPATPLPSVNFNAQLNGWHVDILRTPLSSYPAPHLPRLRAELGSSRLLSAASLLGTLLGGRK